MALNKAVQIPTNLDLLQNATPKWLVHAVSYLNEDSSPRRNAWAKCIAGEWNLNYDCVTSIAALNAWNRLSGFSKACKSRYGV